MLRGSPPSLASPYFCPTATFRRHHVCSVLHHSWLSLVWVASISPTYKLCTCYVYWIELFPSHSWHFRTCTTHTRSQVFWGGIQVHKLENNRTLWIIHSVCITSKYELTLFKIWVIYTLRGSIRASARVLLMWPKEVYQQSSTLPLSIEVQFKKHIHSIPLFLKLMLMEDTFGEHDNNITHTLWQTPSASMTTTDVLKSTLVKKQC